jgi:eukaryotic-like serine/threonine-protein kinase
MEGLKPTTEDHVGRSGEPGIVNRPSGPLDHLKSLGDYTILHELGRGGMGIVYEAERESLKVRVALKVMHTRLRSDRTYLRRFQTEARSAAKLHHTNIVPVFDYGEEDGICYYAMQFIDGVGLDQVLQDVRQLCDPSRCDPVVAGNVGDLTPTLAVAVRPSAASLGLLTGRYKLGSTAEAIATPTESPSLPLDPPSESDPTPSATVATPASRSLAGRHELAYFLEVARFGAQVADALEHAHRQGVVHRDIKPSNLLLDAQGNVWVTDFGLAKLMEGDDLSESHDLVGTMRFMAPERFQAVTDHRGDIYALLTLRQAFAATGQEQLGLPPGWRAPG